MKDFILAALPLVALGVAIAVAVTCGLRAKRAATAAMQNPEDEKPVKKQSDGTHMCLGMCLGLVVGLFCSNFAESWNQGVCMTLGMCIGMMFGSAIDASQGKKMANAPDEPETPAQPEAPEASAEAQQPEAPAEEAPAETPAEPQDKSEN